MRGYRGWLVANTLGIILAIAIVEIDKWNRISNGWLNRPSVPAEMVYLRIWLVFAFLLGALQVAICYGLTRLIPIRGRVLGAIYGIITGIAIPILAIVPARFLFSVYGAEPIPSMYVLLPIGAIAGAITGRTTPQS